MNQHFPFQTWDIGLKFQCIELSSIKKNTRVTKIPLRIQIMQFCSEMGIDDVTTKYALFIQVVKNGSTSDFAKFSEHFLREHNYIFPIISEVCVVLCLLQVYLVKEAFAPPKNQIKSKFRSSFNNLIVKCL